jgi:hypothetical protein
VGWGGVSNRSREHVGFSRHRLGRMRDFVTLPRASYTFTTLEWAYIQVLLVPSVDFYRSPNKLGSMRNDLSSTSQAILLIAHENHAFRLY